jgi:signal transduction histidine kinase
MTRLPIRIRVVAAFAAAMAIVLAATGFFLYTRLRQDLAGALDQDLRLRAQDLSALVSDPRTSLGADSSRRLIERGESFAQLIDRRGRVLQATRAVGTHPLLGPGELGITQPHFFDRPSVRGLDEPARLLAIPVRRGAARLLLVVGATRENGAETLRSLRSEMLIAGPVALLLAIIVGYPLAGYGLRAVEVMRRRASEISAERPGERLPVPRTGDELEQLGHTLNEMLARIERTLERQRGLVAEAGHELRTPLALLRAEIDYALHYAGTPEELRAALATARAGTDRLAQLASDLLLIASSDQGQIALRVETVPVLDLLESVRQRFVWRGEAEGRDLTVAGRSDLLLAVDRVRVEQALANLVENAIRHGQGTVTLRAGVQGEVVELEVRDQGHGFEPDFLGRAFERFSRGDESRSGSGAGLGLAIVQTIASAHHGHAEARNLPDGGAAVRICLPLALAAPRQAAAAGGSSNP